MHIPALWPNFPNLSEIDPRTWPTSEMSRIVGLSRFLRATPPFSAGRVEFEVVHVGIGKDYGPRDPIGW